MANISKPYLVDNVIGELNQSGGGGLPARKMVKLRDDSASDYSYTNNTGYDVVLYYMVRNLSNPAGLNGYISVNGVVLFSASMPPDVTTTITVVVPPGSRSNAYDFRGSRFTVFALVKA